MIMRLLTLMNLGVGFLYKKKIYEEGIFFFIQFGFL